MIRTRRVYDPPSPNNGERLLVARYWPRGVRKDTVDRWEKELGPSVELLRAYRDRRIRWAEFAHRYRGEMRAKPELLEELARRSRSGTVTLLCYEHDQSRCHRSLLQRMVQGSPGEPTQR